MKTGKVLDIYCKCGFKIFRYYKAGKGKIIKCFVNRLHQDLVGISGLANHSKPLCPKCRKELGIIMMIRGEPALKLNNGTVKATRV